MINKNILEIIKIVFAHYFTICYRILMLALNINDDTMSYLRRVAGHGVLDSPPRSQKKDINSCKMQLNSIYVFRPHQQFLRKKGCSQKWDSSPIIVETIVLTQPDDRQLQVFPNIST